MSDDENGYVMCEYCEDKRDMCDRNFLVDDRRFSIKLDETFEFDTVSHNDKSVFVIKHDTGGKRAFGRGSQLPLVAVAQPRPNKRD